MKLKSLFYDTRLLWDYQPYFSMKGWLRFKALKLNFLYKNMMLVKKYGIKLRPKRRHKRSIKARDFGRLFHTLGFDVIEQLYCS